MPITGVDCLTVPCETAKQGTNTLRPIYTGAGYVCVFCGGFFFRYKPCTWHMGLIMNVPCACLRADGWHRNVAFNHQLPCAFCDKEFHDFSGLANHVKSEHVDTVDMLHRIAENIVEEEDERDDMLPQVGSGKRNDRQGQSGGGRRQPPAVPFLVVDDLKPDPVRAKILGLETKNTGFNDVIVKIAIGGKSFFMGLKASNPNYEALTHGLGFDENKWVGQEFMVGLQWNEFYEKNFVQVYECPAPAAPGERKGKAKD